MVLPHKLFNKIDGRNIDLVFTCASDAVRATLFYFESNQPPRVLAHTHQVFKTSPDMDADEVFEQALAVFGDLCDDIARKTQVVYEIEDLFADHQRIHHASVLLASPFTQKEVRIEKSTFDKPKKITQQDINNLLPTDIPQGRTRLDTFVSSLKLNGYEVSPELALGKESSLVELAVVDSYCRFDFVETLFQVIQTKFNLSEHEVEFRPFSSALLMGTKQLYNTTKDYAVVYMHAQYIDAFVCNNNQIVGYSNVRYGYDEVINQLISSKIASSVTQAHSLLEMYTQGHLQQQIHEKIHSLVCGEVQVAVNIIENDMNELARNVFIPHNWYCLCDSSIIRHFVPAFKKVFPSDNITLIEPSHVHDVVDLDQTDRVAAGSILAGLYVNQSRDSNLVH